MKVKMYKYIFSSLLILLSLIGKGQTVDGKLYTIFNNWYQWSGGKFNTNLNIPKVTATTGRDTGAIRYALADSSMYIWTGSQWRSVGQGTDTTSLSNRIDLRVKYTDTSAMLSSYLREIDTTNAFLISVSQPSDSVLRFQKGATQTDYAFKMATSATRLITTVYNNTGSIISKGAVVYINGRHSSNLPTIALAQANTEANSYTTFALVADDIVIGGTGTVIQVGNISGLNLPTSSYTDGDPLYLSPTVAGGYTKTKPLAPNHITKIGTVTRAHPTLGSIQIRIENGWQLDELSDVQISAVPNDSTILQFSRVDSLWKAVDPTTAMGNRFVKTVDTASMLSSYVRSNSAGVRWTGNDSTFSYQMARNGKHVNGDFDFIATNNILGGTEGVNFTATQSLGAFSNFSSSGINGITLSTSTSSGGQAQIFYGYNTAFRTFSFATTDPALSTYRVKLNNLNDGTDRFFLQIGLIDATATNIANGYYFTYDLSGTQTGSATSANWQCVTANGSTRTWTTTSTSVGTGSWVTLSIRVTTSKVIFYINNSIVAEHSTNITTANTGMVIRIIKTNGTNARTLDADYITFDQWYSTQR
jgi:hypothetical protein